MRKETETEAKEEDLKFKPRLGNLQTQQDSLEIKQNVYVPVFARICVRALMDDLVFNYNKTWREAKTHTHTQMERSSLISRQMKRHT